MKYPLRTATTDPRIYMETTPTTGPAPGDADADCVGVEPANTPPVQTIYLKLEQNSNGGYDLDAFLDPAGTQLLTKEFALPLLGDGCGQIEFLPLPPDRTIPDLVIITQTVEYPDHGGRRKATPFKPVSSYPAYNVAGGPGGTLGVIHYHEAVPEGRYKYSIVALSDDGGSLATIDPTVIVKPN